MDKMKSIDFDKIMDKMKSIDFNEIVNKIKSWEVKDYLINNINNILYILFIPLLLLLLAYSIVIWISANKLYMEVQKNKKNIITVNNNNALYSFVKKNKLRTIDSLSNSVMIKLGYSISEKNKLRTEFQVWKVLIFSMCNDKKYLWLVSKSLFWQQVKKCNFKVIWNIEKQDINFKKKFISFVEENDILKKYINDFPNINKESFSDIKNIDVILSSIHRLSLYETLFILDNIGNKFWFYKTNYDGYQAPYLYFLSSIYFPSKGIWKDMFSGKINVNIFWKDYLSKAWYMDLNLIKKWTSYFKKSYNWLFYNWKVNNISSINVWKFTDDKENKLSSLPINLSFGVENDPSFYWLISKLTSTSNILNIMLVNEFTYDLWKWIKFNLLNTFGKYNNVISNSKTIWDKYLSIITNECLFKWDEKFKVLNCSSLFNTNYISFSNIESDLLSSLILSYKVDKKLYEEKDNIKERNIDFVKEKLNELIKKAKKWKYNLNKETKNKILSKFRWDTLGDSLYDILNNKVNNFSDSYYSKYIKNGYTSINSIDKLIWARLYWCIFDNNWYCTDLFKKDDSIIRASIINFADCKDTNGNYITNINDSCRIKFINKFWTNYFIWYTMIKENNNYSLLSRMKDVYRNLSWLIKLNSFTFREWQKVWNIDKIKYNSTVSLNIFYKNIDNNYVSDILSYVWKNKCSNITNNSDWSINKWYFYIKKKIDDLYNSNLSSDDINKLNILADLLSRLDKEAKGADNLHKILLNLQAYRILKERWDCNSK